MSTKVTLPIYHTLLSDFAHVESKKEAEVLKSQRQKGFEVFQTLGFPTRKNEDWKYTSVTPFLQESFLTNGSVKTTNAIAPTLGTIPEMDAYRIVIVNGILHEVDSQLPAGVVVKKFDEVKENEALNNFGKAALLNNMPFAALNTALFNHGIYIEVKANTIVDKPLHIVRVMDAHQPAFIQPRMLIVVNKSAHIKLVESFESESNAHLFVNGVTEVVMKENAQMEHYLIQEAAKGIALVQQTDVSQVRDSVYNNYTFSLPGASLIRNNLHIAMNESQCESHLFGLYLGGDEQLIDNHSIVDHKMPNCNSNEIYKGVLTGKSTGVFNGKIFVREDAQKTNAFQQNNNLLLSDRATINSKPQLEIFADDVKCSHGSTVGQLSEESMFYLQSRGIGKAAAKRLLVNAFAFDVTEKITIPALEEYINNKIAQHIAVSENE